MKKLNLYYRISAEAGLASHNVTGEKASCLTHVSFDVESLPSEEEHKEMERSIIGVLARQTEIKAEYFTPITEAEYNEECAEVEDDAEQTEANGGEAELLDDGNSTMGENDREPEGDK